ncbi:MAG TPA: FAD-dependent oxidoreductase, partial [Anaerolineae bacterium]
AFEEDRTFYGFPALDGPAGGVKVAFHSRQFRAPTTPETIDRNVHPAEIAQMRAVLAEYVPLLAGHELKTATCMYTMTPDEHFVLDRHPEFPQVAIAAGFSGHGFKFCSVVGEVMADLALDGATRHDIAMFGLQRAALQTGPR